MSITRDDAKLRGHAQVRMAPKAQCAGTKHAPHDGRWIYRHSYGQYARESILGRGKYFSLLFLRELPLSNPVFDYLLDCLSHALNEENMTIDVRWYPDRFLLWLLFVGGAAAAGRTRREWFRGQVLAVQARLKMETWTDVLAVLQIFPFVAGCYASFQELWEESRQVMYG